MSDRQIQATTARDPRFETTRDMLSKRYNGVMDPISDEAVQAVLDEIGVEPGDDDCRGCGKAIRRDSKGFWGARKRSDPHPWYCDAGGDEKRHEPAQTEH